MQATARGFSLLEMAAVLAITGILLAVAVPSYKDFLQRQQLRLAGDTLLQDLRSARQLSISAPTSIFVTFHAGKQWCWGVSRALPCDCSATSASATATLARCDIATSNHKQQFPAVVLDTAQDFEFTPGLGRVAKAGAAALRTPGDQHLQVVLNMLGRAHLCGRDAPQGQAC